MDHGKLKTLRSLLIIAILFTILCTLLFYRPDVLPQTVRDAPANIRTIVIQAGTKYKPPPIKAHQKALPAFVPGTPSPAQQAETVTTKPEHAINIINCDNYPMQDNIECVNLRTSSNAKICLHPLSQDIHVSGMLKRSGVWEPQIVGPVKNLLNNCPECQFIDIGANIGVFSLSVASMGRKVIAVEPLSINLLRLTKSIKINNFQEKIVVVANAVSDVYEKVNFWQPKDNAGGTTAISASSSKTFDHRYKKNDDVISTIKLDDLLQVIDFKKAIMKIDIEGYEPKAINGAHKLFDTVEMSHVFMEWGFKGGADPKFIQPMLDFFSKRGYRPCNGNFQPLDSAGYSLTAERTHHWPFDIIWIKQ